MRGRGDLMGGILFYCHNQMYHLGWIGSRGNPILLQAREFRAKYRKNDPSVRSMIQDVNREFIQPLIAEHLARGGQAPSVDEVEAVCAMLLSQIVSDWQLANSELDSVILMLQR